LTWDLSSAIEELENFPEDEVINWTAMARRYQMPYKNGGQVLKKQPKNMA